MMQQDLPTRPERGESIATATLRVDMIADLVCPWCYLGKRRLDSALQAVLGPTRVSWLPFQLNPDMPADGVSFEDYVQSRFGDSQNLEPALEELRRAGAIEGINFRFDRIRRVPNTVNAHRLMKFAEIEGADTSAVAEGILAAFFEQGLDISDRDVLATIGGACGLARQDVARSLEEDWSLVRVETQEAEIRRGGVSGVPNFLINDRLVVVGAQPTAVLVSAFDRAMFGEDSDQPVSASVH
ncbi:MAG: DsbA family oxidoreductase [Woeseiaceae bacterium]|nr:DsbA family oxidoreductase [Woeseiaceae bacterium]